MTRKIEFKNVDKWRLKDFYEGNICGNVNS